jgi:pre-mRNA-splicing factor RBM22/SLT11
LKNVCQTCVLDLKYGLPVEVRDAALEDHEKPSMPTSDLNREYQIEQLERDMLTGSNMSGGNIEGGMSAAGYGKAPAAQHMLEKLQRKQPFYKRNAPHVCSFFVKGTCNRGAGCPYRHEMPTESELSHQNIKDRYNGTNDPVAKKMLKRFTSAPAQASTPPADQSVTTLWVGNVDEKLVEDDMRGVFSKYGDAQYKMVSSRNCAFITFNSRASAEAAMLGLFNKLQVHGQSLRLAWGRRKESQPLNQNVGDQGVVHQNANAYLNSGSNNSSNSNNGQSLQGPAPPGQEQGRAYYPSQDPRQLAAKLPSV